MCDLRVASRRMTVAAVTAAMGLYAFGIPTAVAADAAPQKVAADSDISTPEMKDEGLDEVVVTCLLT